MNTCRLFLVTCCFLALITFSGQVFGDEPPAMHALVSGNVSTITEPMPGTYHVLIESINHNSTIFYENRSVLTPVPFALPVHNSTAAIDLVDNEGKKVTFIVRAANPSYSEENQTLQCELISLEFDEDTKLVPVKERVRKITAGSYTRTNITLEYAV